MSDVTRMAARIRHMTPSATVELAGKVEALKRQGVDILSFSLGEPDFPTPANICEAAKKALDDGYTKYTSAAGLPELREAICDKLQKDNGLSYTPDQIIVTTGAKQALYNALMTLCEPGDEVIIPTPCWVSYVEMVKLTGAAPILVPTSEADGFQLDISRVEAALTPHTRAILINSPNNPTGAVYDEKALRALGRLAAREGLYIIADEIYEKLVFGSASHHSVAALCPEAKPLTVVINGFSKAYSMTGWRIGYAAAEKPIVKAMCSLQGHTTSNTNTIAQRAAITALRGPQDSVERMRQAFDARRQYILERLNRMPGVACAGVEGAFYVFPNVAALYGKRFEDRVIQDAGGLAALLIERAHIAVVPGGAFEAPDNLRLTYASSMENIVEGMNRMEACLGKIH